MNNFQKELDVATGIAKEAGEIMLKYFDENQQVEIKEDNTPVTIADKLINSLTIKALTDAFPDDGVIGEEESTSEFGTGRKWFCDPIDGTAAYVNGVPTATFSLGLVVDGVPTVGVVYDPFLNKLYTAIKGQKSFCNKNIIQVSDKDLQSGVFAVSSSVRTILTTKYLQKMSEDKIRLTTFSGAVYKTCLIARGRLVGYVEDAVSAHDMAAVHVIVEEAGGKITAIDGSTLDYSKPFKGAIVSNGITHEKILEYCSIK